jgi:regulator of protease activity HflC (stomatin/prohibitin superfamily)
MSGLIQVGIWVLPVLIILALVIGPSIRVLWEYERAVVYLLGRFWKVKGPGIILVLPGIQRARKVDMRVQVLDVPGQDVISKDNVSAKVNAVVYYYVYDANRALNRVSDFSRATSELAQTRLRSVLGEHDLDEILQERQKLSNELQMILDEQTEDWGVKVQNVELKQVDIEESMVRIMARRAEAGRERDAKIIEAEGERAAAEQLMQAAQILAMQPEAMQLRYLATLNHIASDRSSTIVFPIPTNLAQMLNIPSGRTNTAES